VNVLHVISSLEVGGAEVLLRDLVQHWARNGTEVSVFVLTSNPGSRELEQAVVRLGATLYSSEIGWRYSPMQLYALYSHLRHRRYDVIHIHHFPALLWVSIAALASRLSVPLVVTEHSTSNRRRQVRVLRHLDRWLYSRVSRVVCITGAVRKELQSWVGSDVFTCTIPNGIDFERFQLRRSDVMSTEAKLQVLCVGNLYKRKGQITLIRAAAAIPEIDVTLVGDGPFRHMLERAVSDYGLEERVHFLGIRTEVRNILSSADLYVQPSLVDGFCIASVEAMASGLPVIASDIPGLRDVVGKAALLVPPGDWQALGKAIRTLLDDPEKRTAMGNESRKAAKAFDVATTAESYLRLYEEVAHRGRRSAHNATDRSRGDSHWKSGD
jgi:glycosyltransferase involved in cell wall biosynthesis